MKYPALSKPLHLPHIRHPDAGRVAFAFLIAWCLLPVFMVAIDLFLGLSSGLAFAEERITFGPIFTQGLALFCRLFRILGSLTIIFALSQALLYRNLLVSLHVVKAQPWVFLLMGLLLWATVSTALSDNPIVQFIGSSGRCDGLFSYFVYASVFCCALRLRDERLRRIVLNCFVGMAVVMCTVMLGQAFRVPIIYQTFESPFAAVFNQFNHFGYVLCMAGLCSMGLFLCARAPKRKVVYILAFALIELSLLVNDTFGCYIATIVGMFALLVFWSRKNGGFQVRALVPLVVFVAISVVSASGLMAPISNGGGLGRNLFQISADLIAVKDGTAEAMQAGTGRMKLWLGAIEMIPDRPLFGYGPEGLMGAYTERFGIDRPHNEVIQYAVFLGIPALLLYLSALLSLAIRQWKNLRELPISVVVAMGVVVGYFASSLFGNTMFNTAPYFWMMLGFAAWLPSGKHVLFGDDSKVQVASILPSSSVPKAVAVALLIAFAALILLIGVAL